MSTIISTITGLRLGRKRRHESLDRRCLNKEWQRLMERTNDLYEVREEEFVRVLWRDRCGLYHNFTIAAAQQLSDEQIVALAIREYGVPSMESIVAVQHVKHRFLVFCSELAIETSTLYQQNSMYHQQIFNHYE